MTLGITYVNSYSRGNNAKEIRRDYFDKQTPECKTGDIFDASNTKVEEDGSEVLNSKLEEAKNAQGVMGKLLNGVKKLTGIGASTKKIEEKIEQYKNGEISYREVEEYINSFKQKQSSAVDITSTIASAAIAAASAIATGKTSFLKSSAIGGAVKTAVKTTERATNGVKNDVFDAKQIGKDALTGAVFGGIAGTAAQAVQKNLVPAKAKSKNEVAPTLQQIRELRKSASQLNKKYKENEKIVLEEYKEFFKDVKSIDDITSRAKSKKSIYSKLLSKFKKGDLKSTDINSCAKVIGDGYGIRVHLKSLTPEQSKEIATKALEGTGKTYDDFVKALTSKKPLSQEYQDVLSELKHAQTGDFTKALCEKIDSKTIHLGEGEFNNFSKWGKSYIPEKDLRQIGISYHKATKKELTIINEIEVLNDNGGKFIGSEGEKPFVTELSKAVKESGYTTAQTNLTSNHTLGTQLADVELQIRGKEVNSFADVEHIPYDIRKGKTKITNLKYKDIYSTMKGLSEDSYKQYNEYLSRVYEHLRLKELGIATEVPKIPNLQYADKNNLAKSYLRNLFSKSNQQLSENSLNKLTMEGLLKHSSK